MKNRPAYNAFLPAYFIVMYGLFLLTMPLFYLRIGNWAPATALLLIAAMVFYPFLYLLAGGLITGFAARFTMSLETNKPGLRRFITGLAAMLTVFPAHLLLLMDAGLFYRYHYHINPHVLNIFTTPGGFEGMGLRSGEILTLGGGILLLLLIHCGIFAAFALLPGLSFAGEWYLKKDKRSLLKIGIPFVILGGAFLLSFVTYTYQHYKMNPTPLLAADSVPLFVKGTSGGFFKTIGIKKPDRDAVRIKLNENVHLENYPQQTIDRSGQKKYNVVWLTCESLAARLYSPETMPATTEFAKKGVYFKNHYSGGNVTRQGVFSLFYGLPASYWHPFLAARRGPLFIDWLKEDGYRFECVTSSKFTYPEFDQTVFMQVPSKNLHEDYTGKSYERDQRNTKRLIKFIETEAAAGNPFFAFMFFESPHNPYEFPKEATVFEDYMDPFNAAGVTEKDGPAIFRRAANCARHLDMRLAEIYQVLEEKDLLKNTIVVLSGDHGEEFLEKGYLGHSSKFNNEQTRTPLIIYYPGILPGVYEGLSSHLDVVPMLAKHFGVTCDPEIYSCGMDLLSAERPERRYAIIANWDQVFFAGEKYKSLIPLNSGDYAKQVVTDANDEELDNVDLFYAEYNPDLIKVQKDLTRFTANDKKSSAGLMIVAAVIAGLVLIGTVAVICIRRRKAATK